MAASKGNDYTLKRKVNPQYTPEELLALAADLLDYAETSRSIHLAPWCRKQKKSMSWLNKIAEDHPEMAEAHVQAKELLAAKVVNSSFYGDGNATVGLAYLPVYDKDFKDCMAWKASLAQRDLTAQDANLIIQAVQYTKSQDKNQEKP